jgi:hypothetical protein
MRPEALQTTIRRVLEKEAQVETAYFKVEDSPQGKILTLVISRNENREDRDWVAKIRTELGALWKDLLDVILLTETTPPLYKYIVQASYYQVLGDRPLEAWTAFTEVVRRRAQTSPMTAETA